jgi:hypothetical protein
MLPIPNQKCKITQRCCWRQFLLNRLGRSEVGPDYLRETTSRAQEGWSHRFQHQTGTFVEETESHEMLRLGHTYK